MMKCPRCKTEFDHFPALSRVDNKTSICSPCGTAEAMWDWEHQHHHLAADMPPVNERI